ncbi:hypothetical protein [Desulfatibacillum alkenivorans]|jgi:hypothetical protein|uniref:hypothetical protein n=1 Tax=Desulfatibacillum alkenivorans TaxID=259354 RepID=UPI00147A7BC7|nr:hypothetical protein [Desulfatibacillum alkenivorans]
MATAKPVKPGLSKNNKALIFSKADKCRDALEKKQKGRTKKSKEIFWLHLKLS